MAQWTYLKKTVEERNVDLVLMGSHGGSYCSRYLVGSALDYMLRESGFRLLFVGEQAVSF